MTPLTRVKAIKSDSDSDSDEQYKGRQFFLEKNRGVTPSVAAPGVTHPSDATGEEGKNEKKRKGMSPHSWRP